MRVVIIANGELNSTINIEPDDIVIAADGGARICVSFNIEPDYIVGDMDSVDRDAIDLFRESNTQIILHPQDKDQTDLELALQQAVHLNPEEIIVFAALGARWDQTLVNLILPTLFPTIPISLIDGYQRIYYIHVGEALKIHGNTGDIVSLIPLGGDAFGIETSGLKFSLENEDLLYQYTRGVSNVLLNNNATISLRKGMLACVVIHQE